MSQTFKYKTGWFLRGAVAAALGLSVHGVAFCQSGDDKGWDLLDQMRRSEKVSSQKLDLEVRAALAEADKLAASDSDKAVARLLAAISMVEQDNVSPKERRDGSQQPRTAEHAPVSGCKFHQPNGRTR